MKLFHTIKNDHMYWLVDQVKQEQVSAHTYIEAFTELFNEWKQQDCHYISVLMDETNHKQMIELGFSKISSIVEYTRELQEVSRHQSNILTHSLIEGKMSDQDFAVLYQTCCSGTANKNKQQSVDEFMRSLQSELGLTWREHCYYFKSGDEVIGLAIPHIEMGTVNEGRLFYFGVVPKWRNQGNGTKIHQIALVLLKDMQATYYVGSTDTATSL
ncbi:MULTISPECIES: GNAT family N-acetyltransferase [Virgibacillus]|uniref:N-acetyltransferase domain-containing protein n=1 Tax=Virgibacillus massiliensis TaxID=1462526 RepID=A0A024Q6D7_9BACI|nr:MULTISPECIES: GNAT family N-acetyltransferase [Virgibacillus]EQB38465.1 hypothetical protein M948_07735 [Virgibacillus sp. CM-4]MYL41172.1 GNAT family N-acetyltransferase [Virgibacillus massiliensis]CDQ38024.1 hypothetical protein BN990_00291 [Virgibacillus massiliensis]